MPIFQHSEHVFNHGDVNHCDAGVLMLLHVDGECLINSKMEETQILERYSKNISYTQVRKHGRNLFMVCEHHLKPTC